MPRKYNEAAARKHLHTLHQTPDLIRTLTAGKEEAALTRQPAPQEWSARDWLAHVRASADVWTMSIDAMVGNDDPVIPYHHPNNWLKEKGYNALSFGENFAAFVAERTRLLALLESLPAETWDRTGRIEGKKNTFSVFNEVYRIAMHESDHWDQLRGLMGTGI